MMISIGYYFDQVSRERMVQRISEQVNLIASSTMTEVPVARNQVIEIETAHPNFHELEITWQADGKEMPAARNSRSLRVADLPAETTSVLVTVVDPTPFVRDPAIRAKVLTATRRWDVAMKGTMDVRRAAPRFTRATPADRPVAAGEVVYATTSPGAIDIHDVRWTLNGTPLQRDPRMRTLPLARLDLPAGAHRLTAAVGNDTRTWTIDNTMPSVKYTLSTPLETRQNADGTPHYVFEEEFTMKLEPSDDQKGYVVAEFRVNGDGWHHYYGWPDAPEGTPYKFTPRGTTIKELVYGSLSSEGLSPQPWEERKPGYGTHRIEYRAIDAAGNIGAAQSFTVTVAPRK
jgi:hypothetical protein